MRLPVVIFFDQDCDYCRKDLEKLEPEDLDQPGMTATRQEFCHDSFWGFRRLRREEKRRKNRGW